MAGPFELSHFEVSCCDLWKVFEGFDTDLGGDLSDQ